MSSRYFIYFLLAVVLTLSFCLSIHATNQELNKFECGTVHPDTLMRQLREAVLRGEMIDHSLYPPPPVTKATPLSHDSLTPKTPVEPTDIFLYEDATGLLLTDFTLGQLVDLMTDAANQLIARDGDQWDFIGFFVNFVPHHRIGGAFYLGLKNNVDGIGLRHFDGHGFFGLSGTKVQGYEMMWNIASWDADSSDLADFTHLVLGQEFEHRFAMFLPDLADGRRLQGYDIFCGRSSHWNFQVDNQGSAMEAKEWVGSSPATIDTSLCPRIHPDVCFNKDMGGVWSYTDLYLMGYVSSTEMDAGNSELRYINVTCLSPYFYSISTFNSSDIIATAGERIPKAESAQHSFRTAWIVIHQPEKPPSNGQLQRVADIATKWTEVWHSSTLGRGFMDNHISPPFVITSVTPEGFLPAMDTFGFDVQVTDVAGAHDPLSGLLHYSIDGGPYLLALLTSLGGGTYHATLPAFAGGSKVNFYVSFESSDGITTIDEPLGAPTTVFSAIAVTSYTQIFSDDFETDQGWTVGDMGDNATTGIWTRVDPNGTGVQPEHDHSEAGTMCYVTGQGTPYPGDFLFENAVDNGKTTLISPTFDLSRKDGVIRYSRWYASNPFIEPDTTELVISISNDNGSSWKMLERATEQVEWITKQFVVSQFVNPTSQMKVRLVASESNPAAGRTLVEAGIDDFEIFTICFAKAGDANSNNHVDLADIIFLRNYFFKGGPGPSSPCRGDANGSTGTPNLVDIFYLVNYLFKGGPAPIKIGACCF